MSVASHFQLPLAHDDLPREPSEKLARPFTRFMELSSSGGIVLLACTFVALIWANFSPEGAESYYQFFHTYVKIYFGEAYLGLSLVHWINDLLMAVFFLLVGLEIKRELLVGELSSVKRAALPAFAAIGGMVVPAGLYAMVNGVTEAGQMRGWGVPMATDIAFALGILALMGSRVPASLKIFLTSLAIVDDLGALLVIALFYTDQLAWSYLGYSALILGLLGVLNYIGVRRSIWYIVPGIFLWYCFLESGVHATIAGVMLAATIPVHTRVDGGRYLRSSRNALDVFENSSGENEDLRTNMKQRSAVMAVNENGRLALPLLHRMEHTLHPWVAFLIIPIFALSNAGVTVQGGLSGLGAVAVDPVSIGIIVGLVLGKPIGVVAFSYLAIKLGIADKPKGTTFKHILGAGCLAGIGFTMALFIANLGFKGEENATYLEHAKVGILIASAISAVIGLGILATCKKKDPEG